MRKAKGDGRKHTAQQTIPYETMYPDGICKLRDNLFSKSIEFSDINYQLAQPDDKTATFEALCDFYNSLNSSVGLQLTFVNRVAGQGDFSKNIAIPPKQDGFDDVREEYRHAQKAACKGQQQACEAQIPHVHTGSRQPYKCKIPAFPT